ncbi:MAG: hypothetical protein IH964_09990 [Candidatus Dadabacteria bacterium]|nr:hypothetical protein [Candidatus Dadabacteria bacterium]
MITRKIEVKDVRELRESGNMRYSLTGFFLSLPWCCITPALLSLFGFFGAVGATRGFLLEVSYPLFVISILLLGRANYLSFYKMRGSRISRALVLISTSVALTLWAFRFGLITV